MTMLWCNTSWQTAYIYSCPRPSECLWKALQAKPARSCFPVKKKDAVLNVIESQLMCFFLSLGKVVDTRYLTWSTFFYNLSSIQVICLFLQVMTSPMTEPYLWFKVLELSFHKPSSMHILVIQQIPFPCLLHRYLYDM